MKEREPFYMDYLYAFTSFNPDTQEEGICGHFKPGTGWVPLVCAYEQLALKLIPVAQEIANISGQQITIKRFEKGKIYGFIKPQK